MYEALDMKRFRTMILSLVILCMSVCSVRNYMALYVYAKEAEGNGEHDTRGLTADVSATAEKMVLN